MRLATRVGVYSLGMYMQCLSLCMNVPLFAAVVGGHILEYSS